MKIKKISEDVEIEFTKNELIVINSALNEICNGIEVFEFETRIGASRANVDRLLMEIHAVLERVERRGKVVEST